MNCGNTMAKLCIPSTVPPATDLACDSSKSVGSPSGMSWCPKRGVRSVRSSVTVGGLVVRLRFCILSLRSDARSFMPSSISFKNYTLSARDKS